MNSPLHKPVTVRPRDAAALLGIGLSTFWRWAKRPGFPPARRLSRSCTVFDVAELLAWRDAR